MRFESKPVQQQISQVHGILVVLENLFDVDGSFLARLKNVAESFAAKLVVHEGLDYPVTCGDWRVELGVRKQESPGRRPDFQRLPAVVRGDLSDLHMSPSASSSSMSSRICREFLF